MICSLGLVGRFGRFWYGLWVPGFIWLMIVGGPYGSWGDRIAEALSLPLAVAPSLPLAVAPSLPLAVAPSLPLAVAPSLPLAVALSLPLAVALSACCSTCYGTEPGTCCGTEPATCCGTELLWHLCSTAAGRDSFHSSVLLAALLICAV